MARKKDPLSARDREIWQKVTESVQPLGKRGDAPPLAPLPKIYIQEETRSLPMEWHTRPSPKPDNSIDRRMQRQIATGRQEVDRSVDLHGMTQDRAFATLKRTIEGAIKRGDKTLLVVTGKGGRRFNQLDATPAATVPERILTSLAVCSGAWCRCGLRGRTSNPSSSLMAPRRPTMVVTVRFMSSSDGVCPVAGRTGPHDPVW
nr:Smr/MutS family protein [Kordiimonas gwangyangensis]